MTDQGPASSGARFTDIANIDSTEEVPPPQFSNYVAEYSADGRTLISHDSHLNNDGEALYQFLLTHSATAPDYDMHIQGSHQETHSRWVTHRHRDGRVEERREHYTETVVDFDFHIDVGQHIVGRDRPGVEWTVADDYATYRGGMVPEIEFNRQRKPASKGEKARAKQMQLERESTGQPPWNAERSPLMASKSIRAFADEYCACPKYLKSFTFKKVVYGWAKDDLLSAVSNSIRSHLYTGNFDITLAPTSSVIIVRSDNHLSRILSNKWLKFLLWLFLIYPFIWLFRRFSSNGGGKWEIGGMAWSMKEWEDAEYAVPEADDVRKATSPLPPAYDDPFQSSSSRLVQAADGSTKKLKGIREGEWFRQWEATILHAVDKSYVSQTPIVMPLEQTVVREAVLLDGY